MAKQGNPSDRVLNLTQGAALVAGDNRTVNSVVLTQGQLFGGGASGVASPINVVGNNGLVVDTSTAGTLNLTIPPMSTPGLTPVSTTTSTTAVASEIMVANGTTLQTFTLPATAAFGTKFAFQGGTNTAGYIVQAASGQTIFESSVSTSAGGTVTPGSQYDAFELRCIVANTSFTFGNGQGSFTLA